VTKMIRSGASDVLDAMWGDEIRCDVGSIRMITTTMSGRDHTEKWTSTYFFFSVRVWDSDQNDQIRSVRCIGCDVGG